MSYSPLHSVFQLKRFLHQKGILVYWQYQVLASFLSLFGALLWTYVSIRYDLELGIIPVALGVVQGFLAFIYMREKGDPRLIFYSLVFSFLTFLLGKYLLYVHYYDWILGGVVDKSQLSFSLLLFYLRAISYASIGDFVVFFRQTISFYDLLWIVLIIASSLEYQVLYKYQNDDDEHGGIDQASYRRIRRRFSE